MSSSATPAAVLTGILVGVASGLAVPLPVPPTPRASPPVAAPEPVPDEPAPAAECPGLPARVDWQIARAWDDLQAQDAALREAQAELVDLIGERPTFEGYPEELLPEAIEAQVLELLDPDAAALEWVDCSEPPCIAVLSITDSDLATMRAAADPLRDGLGTSYPWEAFGVAGGWFVTVPLGPPDEGSMANHRVDLREELIIEELWTGAR